MTLSKIKQQQYDELMARYNDLSAIIQRLDKQRILETRISDKMRMEHELKELKAERAQITDELEALEESEKSSAVNVNPTTPPATNTNNLPKVFISYNHKDKVHVTTLKLLLKMANIPVTIDSEVMSVGQDIEQFINQCMRDTDVTLSVISDNSLESAWVAMETVNTFAAQNLGKKKFIPCYIDSNFFSNEKNQARMQKVEQTIEELKAQIQTRMTQDLAFEDLNLQWKRQRKLRENLPDILAKLQSTLCMDISPNEIERNFPKILQAIQS